jgi:hypothetical protein
LKENGWRRPDLIIRSVRSDLFDEILHTLGFEECFLEAARKKGEPNYLNALETVREAHEEYTSEQVAGTSVNQKASSPQ